MTSYNSGEGVLALSSTGSGASSGTRIDVTLKLPQLQNLCKRDPKGYRDDYDAQLRRLKSECDILALSPSNHPSTSLIELIQFAAAVSSSSYKGKESDNVAQLFIRLLVGNNYEWNDTSNSNNNGSNKKNQQKQSAAMAMMLLNGDSSNNIALQLHRDIRKACVSALILMRNKGAIDPLTLLPIFFQILATVPDKSLKKTLYHHMVNDIHNVNKKGKRNDVLNRSIQIFLHKIIVNINQANSHNHQINKDEDHPLHIAARKAVDMVCDLYRKNVWTSSHTVAILSSAVESPMVNVMTRAIKFFLNIEDKMEHDRQVTEQSQWENSQKIDLHLHSTKTRKRKRRIGKDLKNRTKQQILRENEDAMENEIAMFQKDAGVEASKKLYPAIELINDPQGLAEHLLKKIKASNSTSCKFETKLLLINFVTRLVGNHELILLPLYPLLQRYMGGHQKDVTMILAYTVQACHEYVPPEEIYALLKTIAHNFITERCSEEQMAVGINAVRAICQRVPSALSKEDDESYLEESATAHDAKDEEENDANEKQSKKKISTNKINHYTMLDVEAFARDLAGYAKHRDRSVSIAGRGWANFIREVHPSLLQGKDRGMVGSALHRAGEKPLRYGERKVAAGVEGADLLVEYEAQKADFLKRREEMDIDSDDDDDNDDDDENGGIQEEPMNDVVDSDGDEWVEVEDNDGSDNDDTDMEAPELVEVTENSDGSISVGDENNDKGTVIDLISKSEKERAQIIQNASSKRIFTTSDFEKMRKLVEREQKLRRDPRAAARRKRALAKGKGFEALPDDNEDVSDDSSLDDNEQSIRTHGVVNPMDIMANSKKKRMNKKERLEKIIAGREKFETKVCTHKLNIFSYFSRFVSFFFTLEWNSLLWILFVYVSQQNRVVRVVPLILKRIARRVL